VCSPGAQDTRPCAYCGDEVRTCDGACSWGGWDAGACTGVCTPNDYQGQDCGICGYRERICEADCTWGFYGPCDDPCNECPPYC
jgi:hypothetical protein